MHRFTGKKVLITGGTQGIGLATARMFMNEGATVIVTGRDGGKGSTTVEKLNKDSGETRAYFTKGDVSRIDDIKSLFDYIRSTHSYIDVAVNNAAIISIGKKLHEYSIDEYDKIMSVDLRGMFLCIQKEIELMTTTNKGSIVNISSNVGSRANLYGSSPYIIAKHGVIGLTRVAAIEYAKIGIRVNAILPGITDTEMLRGLASDSMLEKMAKNNPMERIIKASEIASAICFLSSEDASAINGVALEVDCGKHVQS